MTPIICYTLDDFWSLDKILPPRADVYELHTVF